MKRIATLIFSIGFLSVFAQMEDFTKHIKTNPGELTAYIHKPKTQEKSKRLKPLIIALHGCNQDANELAISSGWNELADYFGYYILYPEQKRSNNFVGCFNWFLDSDIDKGKGEIGSIYEMVSYACKEYSIDTSKIFIYGVSGGGMMAVNFLAAYPSLIKSGAILAGGSYKVISKPSEAFSSMKNPKDTTQEELKKRLYSQNPNYTGKFPELIVIHGTSDKIVGYKNSELLVKQWKTVFDIASEKDSVLFRSSEIPSISCRTYYDTNSEPVIRFYTVENWGHYIMVSPGKIPEHGGKVTKHSIDGGFFSTYQICRDWGISTVQSNNSE